ncbi:isocitrate/isopropylmalate dehydrogenase family protein [Microbacterium aoyamense]|uniref:Isocitrate/isopropylmalate dehydrogenase family protein n=1 Tax=Microbacterium aoyamense TaxID=344166 RepID=A0ABN2PC75_9MICO|nr:isocitrate/isopropylmalate family dehydrogenase [Microbacterium aoyamense]
MTVAAGLLRGDGIGPEIVDAAVAVMDAAGADIEWVTLPAGEEAFTNTGSAVPDDTAEALRSLGVALKAPYTTPLTGYTSPSWGIREAIEAYANVRTVQYFAHPGARYPGLNLTLVRDQTEDLSRSVSQRSSDGDVGIGLKIISRHASERVARFAMQWAVDKGDARVTVGHIATGQRATDGLFLESAMDVAPDFPGVSVDEEILDGLMTHLIQDPSSYRILLLESVYGGIMCGVMAGLAGTVGVMPGAIVGPHGAVFEAGHGSAPKYAGTGRANPAGMILSGAMLLDHVGQRDAGDRVRAAVAATIAQGDVVTRDLGGTATTSEFAARCGELAS